MPMLNARCDTCGTVFPSGFYVENSTDITFSESRSGPCPRCGGMGSLIANDTTLDVIGDRITVKRGWISPENLAVIASSFERFQTSQDNRAEVESQIAEAFPQLQKRVQALSTDRLLILISLLLSLIATWQHAPPSEQAARQMVEQALKNVQQTGEETLADVFAAYQAGKTSLHGMRTKITHFFPELKDPVKEMNFDVLSALINIITIVFLERRAHRRAVAQDAENERREAKRQEDFQAAQQYRAEIAGYAKRMVEFQQQAITPQQFNEGLSRLKDEIIREIRQEK